MKRRSERGFSLLEALISIAIATTVIFAITAAVLGSMHATNAALTRQALTDDALNVLSDIRTATAYDATTLATLVGRTSSRTIQRDGKTLTVTISVTQGPGNAPIVARVTVADANGLQSSEQQQLYSEAPAPGSVVDQSSPSPVSR